MTIPTAQPDIGQPDAFWIRVFLSTSVSASEMGKANACWNTA
jgi:hypothetical protein